MYDDYYDHGGGWGWGPWLLMVLMMLVFLALVAWGVFLVWRSTSRAEAGDRGSRPEASPTAEAILAERLARGEIEPAEYRARLDALKPPG